MSTGLMTDLSLSKNTQSWDSLKYKFEAEGEWLKTGPVELEWLYSDGNFCCSIATCSISSKMLTIPRQFLTLIYGLPSRWSEIMPCDKNQSLARIKSLLLHFRASVLYNNDKPNREIWRWIGSSNLMSVALKVNVYVERNTILFQ